MHQFPRNAWYVACYATDLADTPLARTIFDQPIVLWRAADGTPAAIEDRCIHRRVSLSAGTVQGDHIQCGYHGLRFDRAGACQLIPGQDRIPAGAKVRAYPVMERHGFVWLWPGDPARTTPETIPDFSVASSPHFAGKPFQVHVRSNALMCIENALDLSHVAFAHPSTVGNGFIADIEPTIRVEDQTVYVRREMQAVPNAPLYRRVMGIEFADRTQEVRFWPAGNLALHTTVKPAGATEGLCTIVAIGPVTPETDHSHRQFLAMYRDFALDSPDLTDIIADQFLKTVQEDAALIQDQQANWSKDGPDAPMVDLRVDAGPLAARRLLKAARDRD